MLIHEETLFNEALEIQDPRARAEYLNQACNGNDELRQRVERLIRLFPQGEMLEPTSDGVEHAPPPTLVRDHVGDRIGPYKLLEKLGEGGMGVVYMAEQSQPVRRKVALKIIKAGMDTGQVVARFEAERQALALMNHPNISKVLDAGATESGRPYFVMELVRGIPITEFCNVQKLTLRQRLELFASVCEAVHHAHQKGIIHRDLKPSNLLVELHDVKAVPKVIDFGIAKATNQKLTERTLFTNFSQLIGTPMYMSPEQAQQSGLDIDIRSDIYSLGVLLYELLTGTTPFIKETFSQIGYDELRRMIREDEPPRPSARISTLKAEALSTLAINQRSDRLKISQRLRGELDWVVVKALDKDRTRRYQSALEFADDINRFLSGEPIEAHPPSVAYRLRKIARRHRTALATAAMLLLVLLSATAISVRYAILADRASLDAETRRKDAVDQRTIADRERGEAEAQRNEAQRLQAEAVQQRETIRKNLYVADMGLSALDLKSENIARLHTKLQEHIPKSGTSDYRKWEWYYLQAAGRMNERTLHGHTSQVEDVAWSPNGKFIGSTGYDGAFIWNATTGELEKRFTDGPSLKRAAAWSPDSTQFAWGSVGDENAIRIWNSATNEKHVILGHTISLECVAWSPDGQRLASSAMDSTCRLWDVVTRECIKTLTYETGHVKSVAWHPQGKYIATAGHGLRVWNPVDGTLIQDLEDSQGCSSLAFTADGAHLIAVDDKGQYSTIDTDTWEVATKFNAHIGECQSVAVFGNNKFATCGSDGVIKVWAFPECKLLATLYGHDAAVNAVCWDPSGKYLASVSSDKRVNIWNLAQHSRFKLLAVGPSPAIDVTQLKGSSQIGIILESQDRKSLDLATATLKDDGIEKSVFDLRFVAPKTDLDVLVKLAHLEVNKQHSDLLPSFIQSATATSQTKQKISVVWSPDRTRVACMDAGDIRVWSIVKQQQICACPQVKFGGQLKWAQDNRRLGFAGPGMESDGGTLAYAGWAYIFDTDSGKTVHRMQHGNLRQVATAIEWDPSGKRIASGGPSGDVFCWDAQTGKRIANGQIFRVAVRCLAWSPDQSRLAVAGGNALVKIIDPQSCEELLELSDAKSSLKQLIWSNDGQRLIGVDMDGNVVIWDASKGYEYAQSEENRIEQQRTECDQLLTKINELENRGDPQRLSLLDRVLEIDPENRQGLLYRADYFRFHKDYESALRDFERYVLIYPNSQVAWNGYGITLGKLERNEDAIRALTTAIECYGAREICWLNRALIYMKMEDFANARKDVLAVADRPEIAHGMLTLALFDIKTGNRDSYQRICRDMLEKTSDGAIRPDDEWTGRAIALVSNAVPSYTKPLELAKRLLETDKSNLSYQRLMGALLLRAGEFREALQYLTKSVQTDEISEKLDEKYFNLTYARYFLAMCQYKLSSVSESNELLANANGASHRLLDSGIPFFLRLELELIRDEATALVKGEK